MATFPLTLPPPLAEGFSETPAATIARSPADTGAGKSRLRSTAVEYEVSVTYAFNAEQYEAFKQFYEEDLSWGVMAFYWVHPVSLETKRVRMPDSFNAAPRNRAGLWKVSFNLMVMK